MGMGTSGGGKKGGINDINVTPLVDVMLVLLVMFILVTPAMKENIDVDLPEGSGTQVENENEDPMTIVTVDKNKIVHAGGRPIALADVNGEFRRLYKGREKTVLTLKGHKEIQYNDIVKVISALKGAGIETIHIEIDPREAGAGEAQ